MNALEIDRTIVEVLDIFWRRSKVFMSIDPETKILVRLEDHIILIPVVGTLFLPQIIVDCRC